MDVSFLQGLLRALSVDTVLTVALGLLIMVIVLGALGKVLPFSLKSAISEKRNDAVSVILFSILLGLGIILSSAIKPEVSGEGAASASGSAAASAAPSAPRPGAARPTAPRPASSAPSRR